MSDVTIPKAIQNAVAALPGCIGVGMVDVSNSDILIQHYAPGYEDDPSVDLGVSGVVQAFELLRESHLDFDTGPPSRLTFETDTRHACALLVEERYLVIAVCEGTGNSGLTAALLDAHLSGIREGLASLNAMTSDDRR